MTKIVVIGGSQGAVASLRYLAANLPHGFPAPVLAVQHIGSGQSMLPGVLNDADDGRATFAIAGEPLLPGRFYIAPPDHHLLVNDGKVELSRDPRENWARPAIDPLFRTAAHYYGPDAIAVILSGRLNDGTAGLYEIKRQGGVAIVQTPAEAEAPDMPQSALEHVAVDYCLPLRDIPAMLTRLAAASAVGRKIEAPMTGTPDVLATPTAQTCPDCGGAMRQEKVGDLTRFRCHIGHQMTAQILAAAQLDVLQNSFGSALRLLNERAALCHEMAEKAERAGHAQAAAAWRLAAQETRAREEAAKELAALEWKHPEIAA